jgi:hypothetical protein
MFEQIKLTDEQEMCSIQGGGGGMSEIEKKSVGWVVASMPAER